MSGNHHGHEESIRILVIEDNEDIQEATGLIFDLHWPQAQIVQAYRGNDGLSLMKSQSPDLIILDLGLPDIDGMKVLKEIRESGNIPVIILTVRGEEMDKVRGLELGADDFIVKPFSHKELLARIRTVMHRRKADGDNVETVKPPEPGEGLMMDFSSGTILKDARPVKMTNTELSLLKYLALHAGVHLSDENILANIWGDDYTDCSEYLDVYIRRLREKIEDDSSHPVIILRDGNGYRFAAASI